MGLHVLRDWRPELRDSPAAPAGFVALGVILFWAARDGGTSTVVWAPGSLLLLALVVVVAWAAPGSLPGGRAGLIALAAFGAFVGWCYLTILWADVRADAWSGANKTFAFFAVYAVFAIRPWRAVPAGALLGAYSLGVVAIGLWSLHSIATRDLPASGFLEGRLAEPISYANANCALYFSAAIPALFLATRREVPAVARGLLLASAGALVELGLLCQSRMSVFAVPFVLIAYFVIVPGRLRSLVGLLLVGAALAVSMSRLLDVYEAVVDGKGVGGAVEDAQTSVLASAVALFLVGLAWSLVDRRVTMPARVTRGLGIAVVVVVAAAALSAGALFLQHYGDPVDQAGVWWERFKGNDYVADAQTPHIVSGFGGAGRYDIWRVAGSIFLDHPVAGIGVDNFSVDFLRERRIDNNPLYPHSLELRLLQQTGLVGTGLMATFLVAALVAGWGSLRRGRAVERGIAGSALLIVTYWVVHGSVDWLWEIPTLSAAAFASFGLLVALSPTAPRETPRWLVPAIAGGVGLAAIVTFGAAWASAREIDVALRSWRATPVAAYEHLDRARAFDPFSDQPDVIGAVIAAQRGEVDHQRRLLLRALERNGDDWYPYLELGLIEARRGNRAEGLRLLGRAHALNPIEETIEFALERVRDGDPPTQQEMDEEIVRTSDLLTGANQG